jgi:hypothetical protein
MPTVCRSPITTSARRDAGELSPGARSNPSAKDSAPEQKPGGPTSSTPVAHGEKLPPDTD